MLMRFNIRPNVTRWLNLRAIGFGLLTAVLGLLAISIPAYRTILSWCIAISSAFAVLLAAIAFWFNSYDQWLPAKHRGWLERAAGYKPPP